MPAHLVLSVSVFTCSVAALHKHDFTNTTTTLVQLMNLCEPEHIKCQCEFDAYDTSFGACCLNRGNT